MRVIKNEVLHIMDTIQDWYIGKITYQDLEQKIEKILTEEEDE